MHNTVLWENIWGVECRLNCFLAVHDLHLVVKEDNGTHNRLHVLGREWEVVMEEERIYHPIFNHVF